MPENKEKNTIESSETNSTSQTPTDIGFGYPLPLIIGYVNLYVVFFTLALASAEQIATVVTFFCMCILLRIDYNSTKRGWLACGQTMRQPSYPCFQTLVLVWRTRMMNCRKTRSLLMEVKMDEESVPISSD